MATSVRSVVLGDAAALAALYNHYVAKTHVTFETEAVAVADMSQRVSRTLDTQLPWLVAEDSGELLGYAYAAKWKSRRAYRFSVETTIYLDRAQTGKGVGRVLYSALIESLRAMRVHTAIGGIALPNDASIRLHEELGFRKTGHFEAVGFKNDQWIDVGYWQLLL